MPCHSSCHFSGGLEVCHILSVRPKIERREGRSCPNDRWQRFGRSGSSTWRILETSSHLEKVAFLVSCRDMSWPKRTFFQLLQKAHGWWIIWITASKMFSTHFPYYLSIIILESSHQFLHILMVFHHFSSLFHRFGVFLSSDPTESGIGIRQTCIRIGRGEKLWDQRAQSGSPDADSKTWRWRRISDFCWSILINTYSLITFN